MYITYRYLYYNILAFSFLCVFKMFPLDISEHGNPGGLPGLYSGTVAEFTKADTVIFRTNLYNLTTGQSVHPFKRTIKYDSKWLDSTYFLLLSELQINCSTDL